MTHLKAPIYYTVIGKGRGHGPFDTYSFVILCRCPIQKLKGP